MRDPKHNVTAQDDGPPASHRLATVHPFTVSPSGPNQGEQLGQGELFYKGELLAIPLYTNNNTDKLNNGIAPPYTSPLLLSRSPLRTHTKIPNPNTKISQQKIDNIVIIMHIIWHSPLQPQEKY